MTRPKSEDVDTGRARRGFELRAEEARVAKLEADMLGERVATEKENRKLRFGIAITALILMALQVVAVVLVIVNYLFPNERREYA